MKQYTSSLRAISFFVLASLAFEAAARAYADAPVEIAFVTPSVDVRFQSTPVADQGEQLPIILKITPTEAVPAANLTVIAGGVGFGLVGSSQAPRETKYLPGLPQVGWIERAVDVSSGQDGHIEEEFQLNIGSLDRGYLYAELEVIRDDEVPEIYSTILYFASSQHRILFSYTSLEELAEYLSVRQPGFTGLDTKRMRQRGEFSRIEEGMLDEPPPPQFIVQQGMHPMSGGADPCPAFAPIAACPAGNKSVSGAITFKKGESWPVTNAIVRLYKEEETQDVCVAQTRSDDSGKYLFCRDDPGDAPYSVVILTSGDYAHVVECDRSEDPDEDCKQVGLDTEKAFALRSDALTFDQSSAGAIERNLPQDDQWNADAAKALGVYEAVNLVNKALEDKGLTFPSAGKAPGKVRVAYGNSRIGTSTPIWDNGEANIEVSHVDRVDWDVIHHEYGHIVQHYGQLTTKLGGTHRLNVNLCDGKSPGGFQHDLFNYGKEYGTQLAWTEAWPTWLGTWLQQSMRGRFDPEFGAVGDLIYENTYSLAAGWGYDLESFHRYSGTGPDRFGIEAKWPGEGNEVAIQRFLWDLGDTIDAQEADNVELGHEEVWALTVADTPDRLSEFVSVLVTNLVSTQPPSLGTRSSVGELLAAQGMSPLLEPEGRWDWLFGTKELSWVPQFNCTAEDSGVTSFDLDLMDNALTEILETKPDLPDSNSERNGANSYSLSSSDRTAVFGWFRSGTWSVSGTDASGHETGPYPSAYAKIHPARIRWFIMALVVLVLIVYLLVRAGSNSGGP